MKKFLFVPACILLIVSCSSKKNEPKPSPIILPEKASFFPVTSFLKGQLLTLDSLPVTIMHIVAAKGKADTNWLQRHEIRPYLKDFISQEINETNMIPFFKESKFNDQSVDAVTYTYEPIVKLPDSIFLRRWNVYVNHIKGSVSKVYLVKGSKEKGETLTQQLTWQTGQWAKIVTIANRLNGESELVKEEKFVWDFTEK